MTAADWLLGLTDDEGIVVAAIAALSCGGDSASLAAISVLRAPDRDTILTSIYGACKSGASGSRSAMTRFGSRSKARSRTCSRA
jgi:hypothetical protein